MTEHEWLTCDEPAELFRFLTWSKSERKPMLLAVGICRHIWHHLSDFRSRRTVEVSERFADGFAERQELIDANLEAQAAHFEANNHATRAAWFVSADTCFCIRNENDPEVYDSRGTLPASVSSEAVATVRWANADVNGYATWDEDLVSERAIHASLIRDVFGNPFRPVTLDREWLTPTVVALARDIYEKRAFDQMPILADALQDAGCDNSDVLNHCRGDGPHVRGCWVIDMILGKS